MENRTLYIYIYIYIYIYRERERERERGKEMRVVHGLLPRDPCKVFVKSQTALLLLLFFVPFPS